MQQIIVYTKKVFLLSFLSISAAHAAHLSRVSRLVPAMQRSLLAPGIRSQSASNAHQMLLPNDQQKRHYNVFNDVEKSVLRKNPSILPAIHGLAATAYGIGALGGVPILLGSMASVRAATCMALLSDKPVPRAVMSASNTVVGGSAFVGMGPVPFMLIDCLFFSTNAEYFSSGITNSVGYLGWMGSELGLSFYTADYLKRVKPEKNDGKLRDMLALVREKIAGLEKTEDSSTSSGEVDMKKD